MQHYRLMKIVMALNLSVALTACDGNDSQTSQSPMVVPAQETMTTASTDGDPIELEWDTLVPADWRLDKLMEEYNADNLVMMIPAPKN